MTQDATPQRCTIMAAMNQALGDALAIGAQHSTTHLDVAGDGDIRILPAKHGFVSLTDWLEPYDARFGQDGPISDEELGPRAEPLAWSTGASPPSNHGA